MFDQDDVVAHMKERIVLVGAGSAMFTQGIVKDLIHLGLDADLALVDIDPNALDIVYRSIRKIISASGAGICVSATTDRCEALVNATVVITTIGVGGRRAWENDVLVPRRHGLNYPVGDTVGPGGTSRALRMVPAMVAITRDVLDLAPDALFFNYANPMAVICRAVHKHTGAPVVGLCSGTLETVRYLAKALDVPFNDLTYTAAGINHCTWFTSLRLHGKDIMPALRQKGVDITAKASAAVSIHEQDGTPLPHCGLPFESSFDHPFSWQCLNWFGALPAPLDRHVTEFFPQFFREGRYYGKTLGFDEFSFEETIRVGDRIFEEISADANSSNPQREQPPDHFGGEHEQVLDIINAIRQNQNKTYFANLPNTGQVGNLPKTAIVETPAISSDRGLLALPQPPLPTGVAGTLATRYQWVEMTVEAALEQSPA